MAIITTPGAADANSYADVAYADSYFNSRLGSADWTGASAPNKEAALIQSATLLDSLFDWAGEKVTEVQALRWPRGYVEDIDGYDISNTEIPVNVLKAQCELAIFLITNGGYVGEYRTIDRLNVGSIKLDFDNAVASLPIPNIVIELLRGLGAYKGSGKSGSMVVPLYRV